jgi:hypothetical protein
VTGTAGDAARLRAANRHNAVEGLGRGEVDAVGVWLLARQARPEAPGAAAAREAEAMRRLMLQMRHDSNRQFLQALDQSQAKHHALMMEIIRNSGPSDRDRDRDKR